MCSNYDVIRARFYPRQSLQVDRGRAMNEERLISLEVQVRQLNWLLIAVSGILLLVALAASLEGLAVLNLDASERGLLAAQETQKEPRR